MPRRFVAPTEDRLEAVIISETSLREFCATFDWLAAPVALTRMSDGRIRYVNKAWCATWGYSESEAIGRSVQELGVWSDGNDRDRMVADLRRQGILPSTTARARTRSGEILELAGSAAILRVGAEDYILGITHDVTPHSARRESAEQRANALEARAHELQAAMEQLQAYDYTVSHDLRTPVRVVRFHAERLAALPGLDAEARESVSQILEAGRRMDNTIRALLGLARVTSTPVNRQRIDLTAIAHTVAEALRGSEPGRSALVKIQPDVTTEADPELVHVLLANLLENAWKFSASKDPALIEFGRDGDGFYVRDNGIGFAPQDAEKVFRPFERLSTAIPGTGIGLTIAARVVQRHGGSISASPIPGQGTVIRFTLQTPSS